MACTVNLSGISYGCDDLGIGGIVELHLCSLAEALADIGTSNIDSSTRVVSGGGPISDLVTLNFNLKDGFSAFSEVKTVDAAGGFSTVPTIVAEFPRMDATKITALEQMSNGPKEMVALVKTAAGTHHIVGLDYGVFVSTVDGASGTGRNEKNRYQITITGEENGLSYSATETIFNALVA